MPWRRTGDSRHLRWIFFNIFIGFGFHPVPIQLHVFLIAAMYCHYNCSCKCTIVNTWDNQLDLSGDTGMTIEYICGSWTFEDRIGYIEETDHSFRLRQAPTDSRTSSYVEAIDNEQRIVVLDNRSY